MPCALVLFLTPSLLLAPQDTSTTQEPAAETEAERNHIPLRLEDAIAMAAQNAGALRQARLTALSNEGGVVEASGMFDPVFFADITYAYLEQPTSGFFSTLFSETESTTITANQGLRGMLLSGATYSLSLREQDQSANFLADDQADVSFNANFTQPLLRGGWELTATLERRRAELSRDAGYEQLRVASNDAVQAAVDAYWDLAFAREDLEVKRFGLTLAEEQKAVTEARFRVGSVAEVEVVQTEAEIATRTDALLTAQNTLRQAQDNLRLAIADFELDPEIWDFDYDPISELPDAAKTEMDWRAALDVALEQRGELRQRRLDVERAELDWRVAKENADPRLDLVLAGNSYGQDTAIGGAFGPVRQFEFPGYSIGLEFEFPLGNRAYRGAELSTRAQYLLQVRALQDAQNQIASEVRDAVRAINFFAERVAATELASRVAERQLDAEQRRLREGVSTNFQVLSFQNDLLTAKSNELSARTGYAKAITKLNTVQGLSWDGRTLDPATTITNAEQEGERQEELAEQR